MSLRTVEQKVIGRVDQDGAGDNQCFGLGMTMRLLLQCSFMKTTMTRDT